jgi:small subunit ribosomal protein S4
MKLFLKGQRCFMSKCPIETGRPVPGMHGARRGRKMSDYGLQLREKQRLRRQYGLQEGQFRLFFSRVARQRGVTGEQLLQSLESRLDNLVFRLGFAPSRRAARQMVTHRHVAVNGRTASVASMVVPAGAVISVRERPRSSGMVKRQAEGAEAKPLPPWLSVDESGTSGQYLRVPTREEIAPIVDERLVVELYSK